jgi:predicted nuclease of restriction endonuclease-like RecB superfamily
MNQQGLWGLTNPIVTCESSFRDIFEGVANQFSLTVSESVGAMYADESLCYLFKQFGGLY